MTEHSYEIEIKSLLGGKENAEKLKQKMKEKDSGLVEVGSHKQLNHYFIGGNLVNLYEKVKDIVDPEKLEKLKSLSENAKDFSLRTRWADGTVILVVKASVDDTTSSNGTARLEWESKVNKTLDELDELVLASGFTYQAKWSREREDYKYHSLLGEESVVNISIDKNAGYGYLAEFEIVSDDETKAEGLKLQLRDLMKDLEVEELPQDRLARMFDFYNKNWQQYYGTENIFNIE
jgi:adenylate cyclase class IV